MMITPTEHEALWRVADGQTIERPVRRRLIKKGLLNVHGGLTDAALRGFEHAAKRSAWRPPVQQGPREAGTAPSRRSMSAMIAAAMVLSVPPSR